MSTYTVHAINVASFPLGEADKVLTVFSAEKGLIKIIAKSARKPGTKMAGRSEVLCVNELFLAKGRTFEIVTQAQTIEQFSPLRRDLTRLSYALFYAELTSVFGQDLEADCGQWFDHLVASIGLQARALDEPTWLALEFQMSLLDILGYTPELTFCVYCRQVLNDYMLSRFNSELGGVVCLNCVRESKRSRVAERQGNSSYDCHDDLSTVSAGVSITPGVWKHLVLASQQQVSRLQTPRQQSSRVEIVEAACRLLRSYLEHRAGKRLKALDFIEQMKASL